MVKRLRIMGQSSSQISDEQETSNGRSDRHAVSDFGIASNREASDGLEYGNEEPNMAKPRKSRKLSGPTSDDQASNNRDGDSVRNKMRPISLAKATGGGNRSSENTSSGVGTSDELDYSTSVSQNDDDQTTPKPGNPNRGQDTLPLQPSSKSSTTPGPVELEPATTPSLQLLARKRRFSRISRPDGPLKTTPPTSSQHSLDDTVKRKNYGDPPPNKKKRTEQPAPGAPMSQISRQRQTTLKFPSNTLQNIPSSSASSQQNLEGSPSILKTQSAASTLPIGNWAPPSALQRSRGFYTPEEYKAMENFKTHFCDLYSIPPEKFNELVQHSSRDEVKFRLPGCHIVKQGFWNSIYAVLPYRNHVSIARFMRRHFQTPERKSHQWTTEEDNNLATLVEQKGPKWTDIAEILGRTTNDVTQRWKNRVEHRGIQKEGPWSQEECEQLEIALRKCRDLISETGLDVGTDMFEMNEGLIGWGAVSNMLGNKRSRQQCADKWRKIRRKVLRERSGQDAGYAIQKLDAGHQTKLRSKFDSSTPNTPKTSCLPKTPPTTRKSTVDGSGLNVVVPSMRVKKRTSSRKCLGRSDYVRDYDSEEDSINTPKQGVVNENNSGEDHGPFIPYGDTVVPSTPLSADDAQHPSGPEKLVSGSAQHQILTETVPTVNDNDYVSADPATDSDRWSEGIESTHRCESPELGERRVPRSPQRLKEWEKVKESSGGKEGTATGSSDEDSDVSETTQPLTHTRRSHSPDGSHNNSGSSDSSSSNSGSSESDSSESGKSGSEIASGMVDWTFPASGNHKAENKVKPYGIDNATKGDDGSRLGSRGGQGSDFSHVSIEDDNEDGSRSDRSDSSDDTSEDQTEEDSEESHSGSENNDNTLTMEPHASTKVKLEPRHMKAPTSMSPPPVQSSRNSTRPLTPSTPARNNLSTLRSSYRLGSISVREEQSSALKSKKQGNTKEGFEHMSSSASDSDDSSSDESIMKLKPTTAGPRNGISRHVKNVPNRHSLGTSRYEQQEVKTFAVNSRDPSKSGPMETMPKAHGKAKGTSFLGRGQRNKARGLPLGKIRNQRSERSRPLGAAKINGIQDSDCSTAETTSTHSEAGDIPFSFN